MSKQFKEKKEIFRKEVNGVEQNIAEYARENNICWQTAKNRLSKPNTSRKPREAKKDGLLAPFYDIIEHKLSVYNVKASALFRFLKHHGYTGSQSLLQKHVASVKTKLIKKAVLRVESSPGLQGQVDWKESMTLISRTKEKFKINIFLYILSFSKYKYIELTIDKTQNTLFNCMINAFKYCGGVPEEIWFDNMKTVVDDHNVDTGEVTFNEKFLYFQKECGFRPIACRPYRPCTKGIVENLAKLMENLRAYNEEFDTYEELEAIVKQLNEDLNNEVSQATGRVTREYFEQKEKEYLARVNLDHLRYKPDVVVRKVTVESMVNYKKAKYSVPKEYLQEFVELKEEDNRLYIYYSGKEIACHDIFENKRINYQKDHLIGILKDVYTSASNEEIEDKAKQRLESFDFIKRGKANE